ncbi:MAG: LacI family DNA-binding transcriptional regulator [Cyclobacteriaceae bacterium]
MKQTTIKDLAKETNLSISTVSRALHDHPNIAQSTKLKVAKAVKKLNYRPNRQAQNFRHGKSNMLGVIVPDLVTHFFSSALTGMQAEATKHGYNLLICQSGESFQSEVDKVELMTSSQVDGLILSLAMETRHINHLKELSESEVPFVLFDRIVEELNVSKIIVDEIEGAYIATRHLLRNGYERIAHIAGPKGLSVSQRRIKGYSDALREFGQDVKEEYIVHCNFDKDTAYQATSELISLPEPPDAIFAVNDLVAASAMLAMKDSGIHIPQEMGLVGFNNEPIAEFLEPSLSTIEQPSIQIGALAVREVISQIKDPEHYTIQDITLKTRLLERNSSRGKRS